MTRSQDVRSPWAGLGGAYPMSATATPVSWGRRYDGGAGTGFKPAPARTALSPETVSGHWLASSAAWVFARASVQAPISL